MGDQMAIPGTITPGRSGCMIFRLPPAAECQQQDAAMRFRMTLWKTCGCPQIWWACYAHGWCPRMVPMGVASARPPYHVPA